VRLAFIATGGVLLLAAGLVAIAIAGSSGAFGEEKGRDRFRSKLGDVVKRRPWLHR